MKRLKNLLLSTVLCGVSSIAIAVEGFGIGIKIKTRTKSANILIRNENVRQVKLKINDEDLLACDDSRFAKFQLKKTDFKKLQFLIRVNPFHVHIDWENRSFLFL